MRTAGEPGCRLYLITPPRLEPAAFAQTLSDALAAGDVACVQLRLPGAGDEDIAAAARALMPRCHERDVAFVIDDRPDIAAAVGADGVHVNAIRAVAGARRLVGGRAIVGASCGGSRHAAMTAADEGADYVSFGAIFRSPTLPDAKLAPLDVIAWWSGLMEPPCVAVGGITAENCAPAVAAGAGFLAVSAAVWDNPAGPAAAVAALNAAIESAVEQAAAS